MRYIAKRKAPSAAPSVKNPCLVGQIENDAVVAAHGKKFVVIGLVRHNIYTFIRPYAGNVLSERAALKNIKHYLYV